MKVFLVSLLLLVLTAALFFMVSAQKPVAAIVYLTTPIDTYPQDFNFEVMDVNTGEIIFEAASDENECPYGLSPDGNWLLYGVGSYLGSLDYSLLNLVTKHQITNLTPPNFLTWFADSSAFLNLEDVEYHSPQELFLYEIASETQTTIAELGGRLQILPLGNSLVYLNSEREDNFIELYQLDGQSSQLELPYSYSYPYISSFSDDGRFALLSARQEDQDSNFLYLLDMSNSELQMLENTVSATWNPQTNELIYMDIRGNLFVMNPITGESSDLASSLVGDYATYYWSTDGQNLAIEANGPGYTNIVVVDFATNAINRIDTSYTNYWGAGILRWTSPTEFAYIHTDLQGNEQGEKSSDVFLYNLEAQSSQRLTNTPDMLKFKQCVWG